MKYKKNFLLILIVALIFLLATLTAYAIVITDEINEPTTPGWVLSNPYVSEPVAPADTQGLPVAPAVDPSRDGKKLREIPNTFPLPRGEAPSDAPEITDPALQLTPGGVNMPAPIVNFEGLNNTTGVLPPDTDGQVGPNHYVEIVNATVVGIYDKGTGVLMYPTFLLGSLWPGGDPCNSNNGDPIVLYDQLADRWVLTQFALFFPGPFYECFAVSKTGTPTNNPNDWYLYSTLVHGSKMNDYPKLGVWPDGYYMSANQFDGVTFGWAGAGVWVFDRAAMINGLPTAYQYFDLAPVNMNYGGLLPSNLMGNALPPNGAPNYFMSVDQDWFFPDDIMHIFEFQTDWGNPANSTFSLVADKVVAPFDWDLCPNFREQCIHQPDGAPQLEAISDRLMMHLWYRNFGDHESLVVNHTVNADGFGKAGIRWYEFRGGAVDTTLADATIYQQGTYAPDDGSHRWMGSVAMDGAGNISLGYSVSSTSVYPSIRYAGRLAGDPLGTLPQAEEQIIAGSGVQTHSAARWGDYSAMSVDPVDDCTFWYVQEYIEFTGTAPWQTRVASFEFPGCAGPTGTLEGVVEEDVTFDPIIGAQVTAASDQTFGTLSQSPDGYYNFAAIPTGTYTLTAEMYGYLPQTVTGVNIISGTTTVQNLILPPAATYTVESTITDANTGWPLYASLDISGYPPPTKFWSDPVTGYYDRELAEAITYTYSVEAWVPGYLTEIRDVGPLTGDVIEDFALDVDSAACIAPGYVQEITFFEDFESGAPGWTTGGSGSTWALGLGVSPGGPHSGDNVYHADDISYISDQFLHSPVIALPTSTPLLALSYWNYQYIESAGAGCYDGGVLELTIDGGSNWIRLESELLTDPYHGEVDSFNDNPLAGDNAWCGDPQDWLNSIVDLDAFAGETVQFRWRMATDSSVSRPGWDVDDVAVITGCTPTPGGLVVGNVYGGPILGRFDPLVGAEVSNEGGYLTTTAGNGFYTLFSPAGLQEFTAAMVDYGTVVTQVNVIQGDTVRQNFDLPAGKLKMNPDSYEASLLLGESTTLPGTLSNLGELEAAFEFFELDKGLVPMGPMEEPEVVVKPFKQSFA